MKSLVLLMTTLILTTSLAAAGNYNFIKPENLKQSIERQESLILLDIQVENEFTQHHLAGAIPTFAYPVKSDADRGKLQPVLEEIKGSQTPVVVICPRGGGGAKRAYDYLLENGIESQRLTILEGGQEKWPFQDLLANQ